MIRQTPLACKQCSQRKGRWHFFVSATGVCAEMSTRSEDLFYLQIASDTAKALLPWHRAMRIVPQPSGVQPGVGQPQKMDGLDDAGA